MVSKKYTRQQIQEAIEYWQQRLKILDESKSGLLDALANSFGENKAFSNMPNDIGNDEIQKMYDIINEKLFDGKIIRDIPVEIMSYEQICERLKRAYDKAVKISKENKIIDIFKKPDNSFYGVYNSIITNDSKILKWTDNLEFIEEQIMINRTKLKGQSFSLVCASLCHEMIHYYDKKYGEYQHFQKVQMITGIPYDSHATRTFMEKEKEANEDYVNVIPKVDSDVRADNARALALAISALEESSKNINENDVVDNPMKSVGDLTIVSRKCAIVTTF